METPRSTDTPSLRFADVARRLGAAAHAHGLAVPAFRCPPRTAGATRTLRRYPGGTVVSVRLRDRPFRDVVDDMVDGVLAANRVAAPDEHRLRNALHAALDGLLRPADGAAASAAPAAPVVPGAPVTSIATSDLTARAA
ncbi:MAG: hypothetical protein ACHQIG_05210 [Acidimicrobiia bacterium]